VRVLAYAMESELGFGASDERGGEETDRGKRQTGGRDRPGAETDWGKRQTGGKDRPGKRRWTTPTMLEYTLLTHFPKLVQ
jgi:hypothetical protein